MKTTEELKYSINQRVIVKGIKGCVEEVVRSANGKNEYIICFLPSTKDQNSICLLCGESEIKADSPTT